MSYKTAIPFLAIAIATLLPIPSSAQDFDSDEVFELSPFEVSGRNSRGYRASNTLAGEKLGSNVEFSNTGGTLAGLADALGRSLPTAAPSLPVSLIKTADQITINFAIGFYDDLEKVRKQTLNDTLDKIHETVEAQSGLTFEPGDLTIAQGDRKNAKGKRKAEYTSYAHFTVSFDLVAGTSPQKLIRSTRRLIENLALDTSVTRTYYGDANLVVKNPESYRSEIVTTILENLASIETALDGEYKITPTGMNGRVQIQQHSPSEVEVWLNYGYQTTSLRDQKLEDNKLYLSHELALATANRSCNSCCKNQTHSD